MNTRKPKNMWGFWLMLGLLSIWSPHLALAGTAPPIPTGPLDANGNPATPDYYTTANWANSPPLAKFVDTLPGLGKPNNLGQYLSVGKPDIVTYPGSDYYEIDLVEYRERMHSDLPLPGTTLRGYVQVNKGTDTTSCGGVAQPACTSANNTLIPDPVHQLGPTLVTQRDRPVRIKFTNRLPIGPSGDLFIPVDTSVMGAGKGPATAGAVRGEGTPCDNTVEPNSCASYTQNRSAIHLHGGRTPWISDGTPHQWITPAGEITPFTKGVSFANVPDMPDPGDGSTTYYYTNQQSARLMFYHEHAFGITRLNPYIGVAAGYVITDQWEQDLVNRGIIPADQIPLIIQDKTFVDATPTIKHLYNTTTKLFDIPITVPQVRATDPLWNWGSGTPDASGVRPPVTGDLWLPHVYMPAQNPLAGSGGVNPFGRWMYGPWFYPATAVPKGPIANPYYDADCSSPFPAIFAKCSTPGQPPQIPGTPHPSMGMEAFQDSAVVNGTAFPSLTVDPRAYRFRILNAASDRFWNLSFYVADPAQISPDTRPASRLTEVKMAPASPALAAANNWPSGWPTDGREEMVPDPGTCAPGGVNCPNLGPSFFQIGTEGGFLPQPDIRVPQPVTYITDPTAFWVGIVDKTGLALGPAERADVIVDFSAYAGKTLILYNDAPAAWPARVPGYDYYTGAPDLRDSGGYGTGGTFNPITGFWDGGTGPLIGYAPNTRTVMQIIVNPGTPVPFNQAALAAEFTSSAAVTPINPAPVKTLFERAQEPIIVGQAAYATTYPGSYFPPNFPWEGVNQINDHYLQFVTLAGQPVRISTEPKGIHDEMGASFDPIYGRMSGNLAMQLPNPTTLNALLVLYGYSDLPTETVNNSPTVNVQVLGSGTDPIPWQVTDGTQIWKISHNGVDTHPIHFHIFDVQLINRVGWDGQIALPEPNELGWKDTIKISPLMDTIVAVRPRAPLLPFGIPNSLRPLNPAIPIDSPMGFNSVDWQTGQARVPAVTNQLTNFGWEYVWHCHILSHEEMDMMRPIVLNVASLAPNTPTLTSASFSGSSVNLSWTDPTPLATAATQPNQLQNEIGFTIQRCQGSASCTNFTTLANALANSTSYSDLAVSPNTIYRYQMFAYNAAGNSTNSSILNVTTPAVIPPTISTVSPLAGYTIGTGSYSGVITAIGGTAPYSFSITTGSLPNGIALFSNGQLFGGGATIAGTYNFTVTVTDSQSASSSKAFTLVVSPPAISITTASTLPGYTIGSGPYNGIINVTGGTAPYSFSISAGALPSGISLFSNGQLFGGGTTVPGTYNFTVTVTDGAATTTSKAFSLVVSSPAISITNTSPLPGYTVGSGVYNGMLTASGGTAPYTFAITGGALPAGISLFSNGQLFGGGATVAGTYNFTVMVTDALGSTASKPLTLVVSPAPLAIATTSPMPGYTIGTGIYSDIIKATNGAAPYTFSLTAGAMPDGISLFSNGQIYGVGTVPGTFNFTVTVTDSAAATASQAFTLVVSPAAASTLALTTSSPLPSYSIGSGVYNGIISATGGIAPYTFSITAGALPDGISLFSNGQLFGGGATVAGTYNFTVSVTDGAATTVSQPFTLVVL